jgi:hypothetical protein
MLLDVSSHQMHIRGCLTRTTGFQPPQTSHYCVTLQSHTYIGRVQLGWYWQMTVSSDHLCATVATRGKLCVAGKKDAYVSRSGVQASPGERGSTMTPAAIFPSSQTPARLSSTMPILRAPEMVGCGANRARESGTPCAQVRRQHFVSASGIV